MNINDYGTINGEKRRERRRKITGIFIILVILLAGIYILGILTSDGPEYQMRASTIEENHILKEQVAELTEEVEQLKKELAEKDSIISTMPEPDSEAPQPTPTSTVPASPRD